MWEESPPPYVGEGQGEGERIIANPHARRLRTQMTDAERKLWYFLRRNYIDGCHFRRQAPIGPYIVDFVCFRSKVIVELDGGQHMARKAADQRRDAWLECQGFQVLRFWNHDVLRDTDAVLDVIWRALQEEDGT